MPGSCGDFGSFGSGAGSFAVSSFTTALAAGLASTIAWITASLAPAAFNFRTASMLVSKLPGEFLILPMITSSPSFAATIFRMSALVRMAEPLGLSDVAAGGACADAAIARTMISVGTKKRKSGLRDMVASHAVTRIVPCQFFLRVRPWQGPCLVRVCKGAWDLLVTVLLRGVGRESAPGFCRSQVYFRTMRSSTGRATGSIALGKEGEKRGFAALGRKRSTLLASFLPAFDRTTDRKRGHGFSQLHRGVFYTRESANKTGLSRRTKPSIFHRGPKSQNETRYFP